LRRTKRKEVLEADTGIFEIFNIFRIISSNFFRSCQNVGLFNRQKAKPIIRNLVFKHFIIRNVAELGRNFFELDDPIRTI
jgi:hypothetical protein